MKRIIFLSFFILLSHFQFLQAQIIRVQGRITGSDDGLGVVGAVVQIHGTFNGAVANLNGEYTIYCQSDAILDYSALGYIETSVLVAGRTVIDVELVWDEDWPIFYGSFTPWALALPVEDPFGTKTVLSLETVS